MKTDTKAALSLGPSMTKDKMMQAVGRLRKFGRNQKIYILATKEVFNTVNNFEYGESTEKNTLKIINWAC